MGVGGHATPQPLYHQGKEPRYKLYKWVSGPQGPPGFEPRNAQPLSLRYTDYAVPIFSCTILYYIIHNLYHHDHDRDHHIIIT